MFAMIGRLQAHPGRGDALEALLVEAAAGLAGNAACRVYAVHRSDDDGDAVWVYEAWDDEAAHDASLQDPAVRAVIGRGRELIAGISDQRRFALAGGKGV